MQRAFWERKWQNNEIGFHEKETNPRLTRYLSELNLNKGSRILVPLAGKTLDIIWLITKGYYVVAVELSEKAILDFFQENNLIYKRDGDYFQSEKLTFICKDIFQVSSKDLGEINAIYDRAATIALPEQMRQDYLKHLQRLMPNFLGLMILMNYPQGQVQGPPFSVPSDFIANSTSELDIKELENYDINTERKIKGQVLLLKQKPF